MSSSQTHAEPQIDVLTVGHALVDILSGVEDSFLDEEGLAKGTMRLIDTAQADALYSKIGPGSETSGGSAANTAAGVVACGGSAAFIGTVADDQLGKIFSHDIRAAGVRYRTPPLSAAVNTTGWSMILISPDGERTMNTYIGASSEIAMAHLDPSWLSGAAVTYVEGYLFDDAHPPEAWASVIKAVHNAGRKFSITLSDPFCVDRNRDFFLSLLDGSTDICFGNEDELKLLFQQDDFDKALQEISHRCEIAAITRGSRGSVLVSGDTRVNISAEEALVVDTTGAGDLYAAGVLAGLTKGLGLEESGRMGSNAAAQVISRMGARL